MTPGTRMLRARWAMAMVLALLLHLGLLLGVSPHTWPARSTRSVVPAVWVRAVGAKAVPRQPKPSRASALLSDGAANGRTTDYVEREHLSEAPKPVSDWMLALAAVPGEARWHVQVRVWVSAQGVIDHLVVLGAHPAGDWLDALLAPLHHTQMVPGMQDGVAVPSVFVVELSSVDMMLF